MLLRPVIPFPLYRKRMRSLWLSLLLVCVVQACSTGHDNATLCLQQAGCVFSNHSGRCCQPSGPWTCPDIEQGSLLVHGGIYAVVPIVSSIILLLCAFVLAVVFQSPTKRVFVPAEG